MHQNPPRKVRSRGLLAVAAVLFASCLPAGTAKALTVTAVTSDNGYPAHQVQWIDSAGLPRTAILVDQNSTASGPYTGYLRQYFYQAGGVTRTCTGTQNPATGGDLEFSGDGFVQNHTADGGDFSSGNIDGYPGTTTLTLQGSSHAIITYNIPGYLISGDTVPTTVQWFFADGRNDPIFAVSQDSRDNPGDLAADSRSPYGDMAYDGGIDALVGGFSYGDTYKLVTLATAPEEVTQASGWDATTPNTIPYAMQWAEPATVDAEMGHVATLPISVSDQGMDTETSNYNDPPDLFDPRTQSYPDGPLPPANTWAFQIINYSLAASGPTDSKRLAWGANFGRVGGFDNYGDTSLDNTQYSQHSTDPINEPLEGVRAPGGLMAYSTFIVFGPHLGSYLTGTVGQVVTQMEYAARATFSATTGTVATSGPTGVGNASGVPFTYSPAGYNPTYSAWEVAASANAVNATLTPAAGTSLTNPVFLIDGYTSNQLPSSISINGASASGTNYFATLDTAGQRLWITANQAASSAMNLVVTAPPNAPAPAAQTITFGAIPDHLTTDAPFGLAATASSGLPVTFRIISGPASVSGNVLTLAGIAGTVVVEADQAGNASFSPAPPVQQSFMVTAPGAKPVAQTISFAAIPGHFTTDAPFALVATASSGLPVAFSIISGPATVSGDIVTLTGIGGTVVVEADQAGNASFLPAPAVRRSFTVSVPGEPPAITSATSDKGMDGQPFSYQITATNAPSVYGATGLPAGLSINPATGLISGTPRKSGTFAVTVSATNASGAATATLSLKLAPALPVVTLAADMPRVVAGSGDIGQFIVSLSAVQKTNITVKFEIKGTAKDGTDYGTIKATDVIKAGKKSKRIDIRPVGELAGDANKVVKLVLEPSSEYVVGTKKAVKVTIVAP